MTGCQNTHVRKIEATVRTAAFFIIVGAMMMMRMDGSTVLKVGLMIIRT